MMENQFYFSPTFSVCAAFHFAMLSLIVLLQNHFALIMDEKVSIQDTHKLRHEHSHGLMHEYAPDFDGQIFDGPQQ